MMWFAKWFGARAEVREDDEPARHPPVQIVAKPPQPAPAPVASSKPVPAKKGFDPYNSGAFERRNAWERVSRR